MAKRKRRTPAHEETNEVRPERRTRRLMRRVKLLLLLVFLLVAAAPTIISQTNIHQQLLEGQLPNGWQIVSENASLGWTSNQTVTTNSLMDDEGQLLLTCDSATLSRSLLSLLIDQSNLGTLKLVRPTIYLETRPDGSNWEDFVAALSAEQQSQPGKMQLNIEVVEGRVQAVDRLSSQQWTLDDADMTVALGNVIKANGQARLTTQQRPQSGTLKFDWQPKANGQQHLELLADRLPMSPLQPWLARILPEAQVMGALSTDAQLTWIIDPQEGLQLQTTGRLEASQFELAAAVLSGDRLRCQKLVAPWDLKADNEKLSIKQLTVSSDWAEVSAMGSPELSELESLSLEDFGKHETQIHGKLDLAQLAKMLPTALSLRPGMQIDSGELFVELGTGKNVSPHVTASIKGVSGSDGRKQIRWAEPIQLHAQLQHAPTGPQLDEVRLESPFAHAKLQAKQESIDGEFDVDLARLSKELGQFVDLQAWQMRGLGEGTFSLSRLQNQQFTVAANVDLTDMHVAQEGKVVWTDPKLQVEINASGAEENFTPSMIHTGKVELRGPRDHVVVNLLQPASLSDGHQLWQVQVEGKGPLQLWVDRLQPWLALANTDVAGEAHLQAKLQIADEAIRIVESQGSVAQLRVQSEAMSIDEPRIEFHGDGAWHRHTNSLQTKEFQLLGSSFSLSARDATVDIATNSKPTANGRIAFRANLERLASIAGLVGQANTTWPRGMAIGEMKLSTNGQQVQADFGMMVEQLELARIVAATGTAYGRPEIVWREPKLEASGAVKYDLPADHLQLDDFQLRGRTLKLNSSASLGQISSEGRLQANGLLEYDSTELAKLIASYAGLGVQLQGDRQLRFQLAGSLFSPPGTPSQHWTQQWSGSADAGWLSAGLFGLPLGGGRLTSNFQDGQLKVAPLDVAVGKGRITAEPQIRLTPGAEQIVLTPGLLVSNVEISPEVSESMLKYVAPILAGATRTEGQFSVDMEVAKIPLGHPQQAHLQGRLTAHRLSVSPGPMVVQLTAIVKQIEALSKRKQFLQAVTSSRDSSFLQMADQQIEFQVVEGRVYHRNLEFVIDDVPVRSYGSVGFDQTLAIVIEVPIQDRWIENESALRGFAGQVIQIPIQGTFQKPRIDERAVANLSKQLLQGAAKQAIGDELNRQLEKLLRGK